MRLLLVFEDSYSPVESCNTELYRSGSEIFLNPRLFDRTLVVDGCDIRFIPATALPRSQQNIREIMVGLRISLFVGLIGSYLFIFDP